jgi:hypothetical protein
MYAGNTYQYRNYKGGTTYTGISTGSLTDTASFHLGFGTWNGTNIKMMIDTTQADRIASATYLNSVGNFLLGKRNLTASDFGFYYVDMIAYWNTSVNGDNQAQLYNSGNMMNCSSIIDAAPADTCTYTSGDWNVNIADNCQCSTLNNVYPNKVVFYGTGGVFNALFGCTIVAKAFHYRPSAYGNFKVQQRIGSQLKARP